MERIKKRSQRRRLGVCWLVAGKAKWKSWLIRPFAETAGSPLLSIQTFVTRKDSQGRVWGPYEKVDRKTALWMKTLWAAEYTEEEKTLGSIEVGKLADFVVLGGDFMTVPEDEIAKIPVLMTAVGGKIAYEEQGQL